MQWEFVVALVLAVPLVLFPVALIWYLNIGGIYSVIQRARSKGTAPERGAKTVVTGRAEGQRVVGTKK